MQQKMLESLKISIHISKNKQTNQKEAQEQWKSIESLIPEQNMEIKLWRKTTKVAID
jgi:hypothetical protein